LKTKTAEAMKQALCSIYTSTTRVDSVANIYVRCLASLI